MSKDSEGVPTPAPEEVVKLLYQGKKPFLFVWLSVQIASSAEEVTQLVKSFIGGKPISGFPEPPPIEIWKKRWLMAHFDVTFTSG